MICEKFISFYVTRDWFVGKFASARFVIKNLFLVILPSTDALGNLNGFFGNLASNLQTMESRSLLPNQMRLLGEVENRPVYGHSAAFINSVSKTSLKNYFSHFSHSTGPIVPVTQAH